MASQDSDTAAAAAAAAAATATTTTAIGPALDLPPPIRSETKGTWAYDTMTRRVDTEILERTFQDNKGEFEQTWPPEMLQEFNQLRREIQTAAPLTYPKEQTNDDDDHNNEYEAWKTILKPHIDAGETWISAPWMVAEFYVYRRIMDCLRYWNVHSPAYKYDPFWKQKRNGLESSVASAETVLQKIPNLPATSAGLQVALSMPLWGNKMDLSLWPADMAHANQDVFSAVLEQAHENLLHDDSEPLAAYCGPYFGKNGLNIDIIVDNAGFELVTDLAAAQYFVESGLAKTVTFQLKSHPTFVSDALEKDLMETVDYYRQLDATKYPHASAAGQKWKEYLQTGAWKCVEHDFWVQGAPMWNMPTVLYQDLQQRCDLAIVKGDANYRRLLGDLQWDYSNAAFDDVVGHYFPCPVLALRTLKAELGCGMDPQLVKKAAETDDKWLVNGRFGVVQFSQRNQPRRNKS